MGNWGDRNLLEDAPTLYLLSAEGEIQERSVDFSYFKQFIWDPIGRVGRWMPSQNSYQRWANDELLAVDVGIRYHFSASDNIAWHSAFLDPFNNQWLTEIYDQLPNWIDQDFSSSISLSPDLSRALYYTYAGQSTDAVVLWNLENQQALWAVPYNKHPFGSLSVEWARDSSFAIVKLQSQFATDKDSYLELLTRDGQGERIPGLIFPDPISDSTLMSFQLSPTGEQLALVYTDMYGDTGGFTPLNLFVYDIQHREYSYHCPLYLTTGDYDSPLWSSVVIGWALLDHSFQPFLDI